MLFCTYRIDKFSLSSLGEHANLKKCIISHVCVNNRNHHACVIMMFILILFCILSCTAICVCVLGMHLCSPQLFGM